MLISVVVPVYNVERYLPHCVASIRAQKYEPLEIILVDDGSTDGSGALCDSYQEDDSRIRVIHQQSTGAAAARNTGAAAARGEYVYFVDADDALAEDAIGILAERVKDTKPDMCLFGYNKIRSGAGGHREIKSFTPLSKDRPGIYGLDEYIDRFQDVEFNKFVGWEPVWDKLYKLDIIKNNGCYLDKSIRRGHDREFNLRYLDHCGEILVIEDCLYDYFIYDIREGVQTLSSDYQYERFQPITKCYFEWLRPFLMRHGKFHGGHLTAFYHDYFNEVVKCIYWLARRDNPLPADEKQAKIQAIIADGEVREAAGRFVCRNAMEDVNMAGLVSGADIGELMRYVMARTDEIYG